MLAYDCWKYGSNGQKWSFQLGKFWCVVFPS